MTMPSRTNSARPIAPLSRGEISFRLLDLNLLRVFDTMLAEQSVSASAMKLSITPSAVSHALGRLRYLLKDQLFVRGPQGMQATPWAAEIGPRLREALYHLEMALSPIEFLPAESTRDFTVVCSGAVSAVLLPDVISRMREVAPRASITARTWVPGIVREFDDRRIDVLIGGFGHIPERFEFQPLFRDRPVWVLGRDYMQPKAPIDHATVLPRLASVQECSDDNIFRTVTENGLERRIEAGDNSDDAPQQRSSPTFVSCGSTHRARDAYDSIHQSVSRKHEH